MENPHPPLPTKPQPFTRERLLEIDQTILKGIPRNQLLLPDDVRSGAPTLREAITTRDWPTISAARGKFIFALDNTDVIRDRYLEGSPSLDRAVSNRNREWRKPADWSKI